MRESFLKHIHQHHLCRQSDPVLLTVSGGLDSMVMLHLFVSNGFTVSVAHCNFQLRGSESDNDEFFVQDKCAHLQIPFFSKRFDTNNYATQNGISTQMAARDLRYAWFEEIREKEKCEAIATAHHLTDSIETVLFNLINGRGADGLTGIAVKSNHVIRPLLFATRMQIEAYAKLNGITWREDSSNLHDEYTRNFIRQQIIPKLKDINAGLEESMERGIEKNKGITELMQIGLSAWASEYVVKTGKRIAIQKEAIKQLHHPVGVLYELIKSYGFSLDQCAQIIPALESQSGKLFLSTTHQLVNDREDLIITAIPLQGRETQIESGDSYSTLGDWIIEIEENNDFSLSANPFLAIMDADKIKFPLRWRRWKEGDSFYPLGMDQRKKISDFLIDRKISLGEKSSVTVLESNGEIIWVVGHRISNRVKVTADTKRALRLLLTSSFV
jgi:tRNA(Ile)-lysidine synthase